MTLNDCLPNDIVELYTDERGSIYATPTDHTFTAQVSSYPLSQIGVVVLWSRGEYRHSKRVPGHYAIISRRPG